MNRDIVGDVRQGAQQALEKTEETAESAKDSILEAIGRVSEIFRAVRSFGLDDALGTVGLQRRRSNTMALSMFGVGIACGAVLGVMLAPASGRDARRAIGKRVSDLFEKSEEKVHTAVDKAKEKVEDVKTIAKEKVEDVKTAAKETASTIEHGIDTASSKVGIRRSPEVYDSTNNGRSR